MNHTRFPKEDHLPYWARRDNKDTKGDRVDYLVCSVAIYMQTSNVQHCWHFCVIFKGTSGFAGSVDMFHTNTRVIHLVVNNA